MNIIDSIKKEAKKNIKTIVLPESTDERIISAVRKIDEEGLANIKLLGNKEDINSSAQKQGFSINDCKRVEIINPDNIGEKMLNEYSNMLYEVRKNKGMTKKKALKLVQEPLYLGTMMVHAEDADGMVAGAVNPTGDVMLPAFQIIKTPPDISLVSSCIGLILPGAERDKDKILFFADCAINPEPDYRQLADIGICSAQTYENLLGLEARVAFLSFSTKGSASHRLVDKVRKAADRAVEKAPQFIIDGELQVDAALAESVAALKSPDSKVAGSANVLIFPDLQAGNIGYKLVHRLANARTFGPIMQGLAKPVNDLSRGCSAENIVNVVTITSLQAAGKIGY